MAAVELQSIVKSFGATPVLGGIDLAAGEDVHVRGERGARGAAQDEHLDALAAVDVLGAAGARAEPPRELLTAEDVARGLTAR